MKGFRFSSLSLLWKILLSTSVALTALFGITGWIVQNHVISTTSLSLEEEVASSLQAYESLWKSRGEKLSKQTGAPPLDLSDPLRELEQAWRHLGFAPTGAATVPDFLARAMTAWRARWDLQRSRADTIGTAGAVQRPVP